MDYGLRNNNINTNQLEFNSNSLEISLHSNEYSKSEPENHEELSLGDVESDETGTANLKSSEFFN